MSKIPLEKHFRFVFTLFYIVLGIIAAYFLFTKIIWWFLPFLLAALFAFMADPLVRFLQNKARFPRKLATVTAILAVITVVFFVIWMLLKRIGIEISAIASTLPQILDSLPDTMEKISGKWDILNEYMQDHNIQIDLENLIASAIESLSGIIKTFTQFAGNSAYKIISKLPSILISIIVCLLSTYFISSDKEKIFAFLNKQISPAFKKKMLQVKGFLFDALFKYIKAQLILMSITFTELTIAFLILRLPSAFLLAMLISVVDALPILGTGTILIPWAVIQILLGNYKFAISLLIIYGICLLVRQLLEPRIVSDQIGMYPLLTLMAMYIGLNTLGFLGMILGIIVLIVVINLHKSGLVKLWKT